MVFFQPSSLFYMRWWWWWWVIFYYDQYRVSVEWYMNIYMTITPTCTSGSLNHILWKHMFRAEDLEVSAFYGLDILRSQHLDGRTFISLSISRAELLKVLAFYIHSFVPSSAPSQLSLTAQSKQPQLLIFRGKTFWNLTLTRETSCYTADEFNNLCFGCL